MVCHNLLKPLTVLVYNVLQSCLIIIVNGAVDCSAVKDSVVCACHSYFKVSAKRWDRCKTQCVTDQFGAQAKSSKFMNANLNYSACYLS